MKKPIPIPLNDANMLRIIRELAQKTENVFIEPHAKKRMKQRYITRTQIYACLLKGVIDEAAQGLIMYHYTESGLQNVYLSNGFKVRNTEAGKAVAIVDANGLHLAIGRHIASKSHMTGAEFRFLRKELDLSQTRFGALLDVSEEAVSLWERRGRIPKSACRWMQALYLESVNGNVRVKDLIEQLANLDREQQDKLVFEDTEAGWREAA